MGHMEENMQKETTEETLHSSRTLRQRQDNKRSQVHSKMLKDYSRFDGRNSGYQKKSVRT